MINGENNADPTSARGFTIHNIYVKDVSFESPNTPQIFSIHWDPKVDFDLAINSSKIADNVWESTLDVTVKVSVKIEEAKREEHKGKEFETAFITEVKLAGIFTLAGFDKEQADKILATAIPALLFPYLRETVSSLVSKGGFPQLILPPMDFDAMYQKHLEENNNNLQSPVKVN